MSETQDITWLTQDAYDRLQDELAHLSGEGRTDIAQKIEEARDEGDLKENGGYHAAREEQGKLEARIRQIELILATAQVGDASSDTSVVSPGQLVTAKVGPREITFLLGNREIAGEDSDLSVYSEKSPLGAAVIGLPVGGTSSYAAPNGKDITVEVLKIEAYTG